MIDLEKLAKTTQENFIEVTLKMPEPLKVKVYQTSPPLIWGLTPSMSRPSMPKVEMKLGSGRIQMRNAKEGDPEFTEYELSLVTYEAEADALQDAAALVFPLKDMRYPKDLSKPPPSHEYLKGIYPKHELLRKAWWLKAVLLCIPDNFTLVQTAIIQLNHGTSATRVDEIKKNSESITGGDKLD